MDDATIHSLLEDLKKPDETVRDRATAELWRMWFMQKGIYGLELLERGQVLMESGAFQEAETLLSEVIATQPDFAEAWNRRAVLYFLQNRYRESLEDCEIALELNPIHFGALHGKGLCHAALNEYVAAIQAFRKALEIQPYATVNQRLILECTAQLS
ncbi:tetratricopeptide repeat protein [Leptolyngbya sp. AN02str]|uniref:tetratricopeptide repeat protein n=1 Tax=Leptolyngbya sp. AN02str TaxID=3423363 RepID=UPI003D30F400